MIVECCHFFSGNGHGIKLDRLLLLQIGATLSSKWTELPRKKLFVFYFFRLIYVGIGLTKKISIRHFSKFWPYPPRLANNATFSVQAFFWSFDKPA